MIRGAVAALVALAALAAPAGAAAYGWPLKPFHEQHPIRGGFGDPRYHVGAESQVSSFHFGVDIVARDGQRVYSVEPGYVRAEPANVTVSRRSGRRFEYWHIRPVVHTGQFVRTRQLLGYVRRGWGHVHFAESDDGSYRDPLRPSALTPFYDHKTPIVSVVQLLGPGGEVRRRQPRHRARRRHGERVRHAAAGAAGAVAGRPRRAGLDLVGAARP